MQGAGNCPATLTGKAASLQAWLIPTAAVNLPFMSFAWKSRDSPAVTESAERQRDGGTGLALSPLQQDYSPQKRWKFCPTGFLSKSLTCRVQHRGNGGSLLYLYPFNPTRSLQVSDFSSPGHTRAVSVKPPANSPSAGGFQSPNARETQGLTLTQRESNWRSLTVPPD